MLLGLLDGSGWTGSFNLDPGRARSRFVLQGLGLEADDARHISLATGCFETRRGLRWISTPCCRRTTHRSGMHRRQKRVRRGSRGSLQVRLHVANGQLQPSRTQASDIPTRDSHRRHLRSRHPATARRRVHNSRIHSTPQSSLPCPTSGHSIKRQPAIHPSSSHPLVTGMDETIRAICAL